MIDEIKNKLRAIALAEAIIQPEWQYRYFSFDSKWAPDEEMASMRDGEGGTWFLLFQPNGIGYKCISPEDGLIENIEEIGKQLPVHYQTFYNEPAFSVDTASSIWIFENQKWKKFGKESIQWIIDLDQVLNWKPEDYKSWAEEYYEREFDLDALNSIFNLDVTSEILSRLNPEITLNDLAEDLTQIGISVPTSESRNEKKIVVEILVA